MSPDRGRQLWLVPVLLITVIVTATGGLIAHTLYQPPPDPGGAPAAVLPTQTQVPPEEQPGPGVVRGTADAIAHPLFEQFQAVLQTYFDAINNRDYESWMGTVTQNRIDTQPEPTWRKNYRSTRDGRIVIYRIELAEEDTAARVLMTFTSTQHPSDAPQELPVGCIDWNVVFPLVQQDSDWKIDSGTTASSPQLEPC